MKNNFEQNAEPIALGALRGAYGLKGWVRIDPFQDGEALLASKKWLHMFRDGTFKELAVQQVKPHGSGIVAKFAGIETPEEASMLKGAVGLMRADFPAPAEGEFYWVDLIGCQVINTKDQVLGKVEALDSNGVQDILDVRSSESRFLIPFIDHYVLSVDVTEKMIRVDWELDWK